MTDMDDYRRTITAQGNAVQPDDRVPARLYLEEWHAARRFRRQRNWWIAAAAAWFAVAMFFAWMIWRVA